MGKKRDETDDHEPATAADVRYRWQLLRAGPLRLDGGSMFGVVPRAVWGRVETPDDEGRVALGHNCLLLEPVGRGSRAVGGRVLVEAGSGGKFDAKMRRIFGLSDYTVVDALREAGVAPEEVRHAVVSHLHFDHCGGLTRLAREGERPAWTDDRGDGFPGVVRTFPDAEVIVQRREWDDAVANRSVMTRTYLPENLEPLREHVRLVDGRPPFPPGEVPDRDAMPASPLAARATPVLPGVDVFLIPGHTWGQQAVRFTDDAGRTVVFAADLLPTVHHVGAAYNMAYDVEPYASTVTRRWFLAEAAAHDWLLVLDHDPGNPLQRVKPDGKGWFKLVPEPEGS